MSASVDERVTDEIEALKAILMDDVDIIYVEDVPSAIETVVHPSTGNDVNRQFVCVTLKVVLTPKYPETSPEVILRNPRGLDDALMAKLNSLIEEKLTACLGQPVVFELIELIREKLTLSNLPRGQCVICLYGFSEGDVFIKTQCYHHFHSHCLCSHLVAAKKYYWEEMDKLPNWQQTEGLPYQQTCPVCRSVLTCDVETLKKAPVPVDSLTAPPFRLTAEMKAMQMKMAKLLARQRAKGGLVGQDTGPPPLTITTAADNNNESAGTSSGSKVAAKAEGGGSARSNGQPASDQAGPSSPQPRPDYRGPYRGFNRRGKPGRRGRGGR